MRRGKRPTVAPVRKETLDRRAFFAWAGRRGLVLGVAATSMPALLAACTTDTDEETTVAASPGATGEGRARSIVGDVTEFELTSDEWDGAFGFVTFRLHRGAVDGEDVFFIRTDASDETFARTEKLVWVPKLAGLIPAKATADAYLISGGVDDQPVVLSSEPGNDDYTPAWRVHRAEWRGTPTELRSAREVKAAEAAGDLSIDVTNIVLNAPVVKWSTGEMPADDVRTEYLGPGQLLEAPDTDAMRVRFKLHECFPDVRYIVTDVSMKPMAEGMKVGHSPKLLEAREAKATGRTNVFMNGIKGSGPMGFQPSVFDSKAGTSQWSPYWDHMTYAWKEGKAPRVLTSEKSVHEARDAGDLEEFPGTPDTKGEIFVVNCPVPVLAPSTFKG